jgi:hypothetical protein
MGLPQMISGAHSIGAVEAFQYLRLLKGQIGDMNDMIGSDNAAESRSEMPHIPGSESQGFNEFPDQSRMSCLFQCRQFKDDRKFFKFSLGREPVSQKRWFIFL